MPTELSEKMRELADRVSEHEAVDLRSKADAFDSATEALNSRDPSPDAVKKMLGAWARARRAYCHSSGEDLF